MKLMMESDFNESKYLAEKCLIEQWRAIGITCTDVTGYLDLLKRLPT